MSNPYTSVIEKLSQHGIQAFFQNEHQLVISAQLDPVWPNAGNSFWITHKDGCWYLSTWVPVSYRVPLATDIVEVCLAFMQVGDRAQPVLPADIMMCYGLIQLNDEETDHLCREWTGTGPEGDDNT